MPSQDTLAVILKKVTAKAQRATRNFPGEYPGISDGLSVAHRMPALLNASDQVALTVDLTDQLKYQTWS